MLVHMAFRGRPGRFSCYADEVQIDEDRATLPDGSQERVFDAYLVNVRSKHGHFPVVRARDLSHIGCSHLRMAGMPDQ